jgi:multiple sugar transport system permease protein
LALFTLYPFVYSVVASLFNINLTEPHWGSFQGLGNFVRLFGDSLFQAALFNTLLITVGSILLELVAAFLMAHLLVAIAHLPGSQIIRTLYILPMMITPVVTGLLWNYILDPFWGVMNYLITVVGLPPPPWFSDASTALPTIILVNVWQWNPFLTLLTIAGLVSIPRDLYEAARIDGARWYHLIVRVEVPMIWNTLMVGVIFRMVDNFRIFDIIYASTRGGPAASTEVLSLFVYRQTFQYFNVGYGAAAALIVLFIAVVLANLAAKFIRVEGAYA